MTSARSAIFDGIRHSLRRDRLPPGEQAALARRLAEPRANVIPARGKGDNLVDRFAAMVVETQATLDRIASRAEAPAAIARFLSQAGLSPSVAASSALSGLDWSGCAVRFGAALAGDQVSVTPALKGVAETGTLVLASDAEHPSSLNFLPDIHIVLVLAVDVIGCYEEAWAVLRQAGSWPRTVNWITGPSRTADIEQSLLLGAHGPRRLHVVLCDDA